MSMRVVLLDSGGANMGSVQAAFARLQVDAPVTDDWQRIRAATHVILPGVGAAAAAMQKLRSNKLIDLIPTLTQPLLGICVGMQLLFERSEESDTPCLGLLPGSVKKLAASDGIRIPHMGWNRLVPTSSAAASNHPLVDGLVNQHAYFVHSYAAAVSSYSQLTCQHGQDFSAVVAHGRIHGAQFHPERSAAAGARLLSNFLKL